MVGNLDAVPGLFQAITDGPDAEEKWTILSFPIDIAVDTALPHGMKNVDLEFNMNIRKWIKFN